MEHPNTSLPLLSIVIATRNRVPYAISAIRSILGILDPRLHLVVQDNSDSRELESYVHTHFRDRRLRYRYSPPPMSMIDNFNAAVELAKGEFVCLIGDDDGINVEIIEAAEWAKANGVDALTSRVICNYLWPNSGVRSTPFTKIEGAELFISEFSGEICDVDVNREVQKLIRNGGVDYLSFHLPKLYHGLVRRRCLDEIHDKIGVYFGGLSPDIFSVLAISEVAKKVVFIDYPLTIPGSCPGSGSTYKSTKQFGGRLEETFLFRNRSEYVWCELVPRVYTAETVWVDSGIAALRAMGRDDLVKRLNLPKLAAHCIGPNRCVAVTVVRDLFKGLRLTGKSPILGALQFVWCIFTGPGMKFFSRAWNRLLLIMQVRVIHNIKELNNMVEVSSAITHYLHSNHRSFSDCVEG